MKVHTTPDARFPISVGAAAALAHRPLGAVRRRPVRQARRTRKEPRAAGRKVPARAPSRRHPGRGGARSRRPRHAGVNPQIAGLQVALRAHGLYLAQIDGIAGPRTAAAVHAFQRRKHLPVGVADMRTRAALGPLGRPLFGSRTLRRGDFGWDVAVLQFLLTRARRLQRRARRLPRQGDRRCAARATSARCSCMRTPSSARGRSRRSSGATACRFARRVHGTTRSPPRATSCAPATR